MHLCFIQHVPFETPGKIIDWAQQRGHTFEVRQLYSGDAFPSLSSFDWLIIIGGSMGINDERLYPWLAKEKAFVQKTIRYGKKVLGICLGAQLIADALGAKVRKNSEKEIGWFPVDIMHKESHPLWSEQSTIEPLHWHGDAFDIPKGSVHIASSAGCKNQAFIYDNRVVALQFHLEIANEGVCRLIKHCACELSETGVYIQGQERIAGQQKTLTVAHESLYQLLDGMAKF